MDRETKPFLRCTKLVQIYLYSYLLQRSCILFLKRTTIFLESGLSFSSIFGGSEFAGGSSSVSLPGAFRRWNGSDCNPSYLFGDLQTTEKSLCTVSESSTTLDLGADCAVLLPWMLGLTLAV